MKSLLLLFALAAMFLSCNEPSGEGAGNDTGTDVHNNYPDSVQADTAATKH